MGTQEDPLVTTFMRYRLCGKGTSYFLWNNVQSYYEKLEHAFTDIISDVPKDYLYPCFITLSSATLEYSLNFMYALYCFQHFEYDKYQIYLDTYRNMRFKNKLFMLPYILSHGAMVINEDSETIKALCKLISKRNALLHNSEKLQQFDSPDIGATLIGNNIAIPIENTDIHFTISVEDKIIDSITKEDCVQIGNAMLSFYKHVIYPYVNNHGIKACDCIKKY